jgi:three-Cys-motif partner protein
MNEHAEIDLDIIGFWSEVKLDILKDYATRYSTVLAAQQDPKLHHVYIEGFAGAGEHISKTTGEYVKGSPWNALNVVPVFEQYHLVDLKEERVENLQRIAKGQPNVHLYTGDCNAILLEQIFPQVRYEDYKRGLCILDPYGLNVDWNVVQTAGRMGTLDLFLNFPVEGINRNALRRDPDKVPVSAVKRMNAFWGDETWRDIAYDTTANLFGYPEKESNEVIAEAYRQRLMRVAGFKRVPNPMPMRNSKGAIVYYLFFASQKDVAENIIVHIFKKYGQKE